LLVFDSVRQQAHFYDGGSGIRGQGPQPTRCPNMEFTIAHARKNASFGVPPRIRVQVAPGRLAASGVRTEDLAGGLGHVELRSTG
jgi:hypothetical protein